MLKVNGYKMMVVFGDTDGACSVLGTRKWIKSLGWKKTEQWTPWIMDDQLIGYKEKYGNYTFATIHGHGHLAMYERKKESFSLILDYIT